MKLLFTPEAVFDLKSICNWIARDNPERAATFVDELEASCADILLFPEKYQLAVRFERQGLRRKVHGNYSIFYRIKPDAVEVIHILHGARDFTELL
jgi:toxin ParE1/3/4